MEYNKDMDAVYDLEIKCKYYLADCIGRGHRKI
jgi:hypothetical protein